MTAAWDREWQRSRRHRGTPARLAEWGRTDPVLLPYTDLDTLLGATGRDLPMAEADGVLAAVVRRAATDDLAALVVLRRVLPGLLRIAVRRSAAGRRPARALFDELTASAWLVIRTFPLDRRPAKIAVNILRDAEYLVCVQPYRLRSARERPAGDEAVTAARAGLDGRPEGSPRHAGVELGELLELARAGGVTDDDVELLRALYLAGEPVHAVARRLAVSPRTVLNRRLAATARIREAAA